MCSTIRPLLGANRFSVLQPGHFCKALALGLHFRLFAHNITQIYRPQVCSTVRPRLGAHGFIFLQRRHLCTAQAGSSPQDFFLGYLLITAQRIVLDPLPPPTGALFQFSATKAFL